MSILKHYKRLVELVNRRHTISLVSDEWQEYLVEVEKTATLFVVANENITGEKRLKRIRKDLEALADEGNHGEDYELAGAITRLSSLLQFVWERREKHIE